MGLGLRPIGLPSASRIATDGELSRQQNRSGYAQFDPRNQLGRCPEAHSFALAELWINLEWYEANECDLRTLVLYWAVARRQNRIAMSCRDAAEAPDQPRVINVQTNLNGFKGTTKRRRHIPLSTAKISAVEIWILSHS